MKRVQVLLGLVFLVGCGPRDVLSPKTVTATLEATGTPTSTLTSTPIPRLTATPFRATPVTPMPTWLPQEQEAYLLDLIRTNKNCRLPCLFGLQPGISTWEEIRKLESPFYFRKAYLPDDNGVLYLHASVPDKLEHPEVTFSGSSRRIEHITAAINIFLPSDPRHSLAMAAAARAYFLPNILAEYGPPSRILFHAQEQIEPNSGTLAELLLFYDQLGFGIHYFFVNVITQDPVNSATRICLNEDHFESFGLYLQAPQDRTPLEKMVHTAIGHRFFPYEWLQPIDEVTSLTIKDFYKRYTGSPIKDCFDLK